MPRILAGALGALVLGWLTSVGLAETPPPLELPMPAPQRPAAVPAAPGVPLPEACVPGGPRVLGYGYDPAQGILIFTVHDDPSYLIWEGYTGHGRPPAWCTHCWSRICHLCGR